MSEKHLLEMSRNAYEALRTENIRLREQLAAARELLNLARDAYRGCYDLNDEWAKKAAEVCNES